VFTARYALSPYVPLVFKLIRTLLVVLSDVIGVRVKNL
jgi:hypothetical protein